MNLFDLDKKSLSGELDTDISFFKSLFKGDDVLRVRNLKMKCGLKAALLFFDGMVNNEILNESVVRPLLLYSFNLNESPSESAVEYVLFTAETSRFNNIKDMVSSLLYGDTLILFDNDKTALTVNTKGWRTRGINEPEDERVLEGPREGFDEAVMLNLAMLRRKLLTPDFKAEYVTLGRRTDTKGFICYLGSLVNRTALRLVKSKLKQINIDGILDVNYVNELINPNRFSLFKTAGTTERPDVVAARLLEGRVALLLDGTPVALTFPFLFSENFQSDDDYYQNYVYAFSGRILRFISFIISIVLPGFYLSLITHHKLLLPTSLYISVSSLSEGVPFSGITECVILILVFEMLRESGLRVPQSMGHALSIVGGLVIGQSAVEAKLVSAPMLIVVAASGIAGLMLQKLKAAVFYGKLTVLVLGNFFGLLGCFVGVTVLLCFIFSLDSFGTDYTSALNKISFQSLKDTLFRAPFFKMLKRPNSLSRNVIRQKSEDKK